MNTQITKTIFHPLHLLVLSQRAHHKNLSLCLHIISVSWYSLAGRGQKIFNLGRICSIYTLHLASDFMGFDMLTLRQERDTHTSG